MNPDYVNLVFCVGLTVYFFMAVFALSWGTRCAQSGYFTSEQIWLRVGASLLAIGFAAVVWCQFAAGGLDSVGYVVGLLSAFSTGFATDLPARRVAAR